jgi:hypothetical protein
MLGGFIVDESMNRGRLRNGVFISSGVNTSGANGRAIGAGVLCVAISQVVVFCLSKSGDSMELARGFAVGGGDDDIASACVSFVEAEGVLLSVRRRLFPFLLGAKRASKSASRTPGVSVSVSSGGVLSIASSRISFMPLAPTPLFLITSTSSESSITSRRWRERAAT